MRKMVVLGMSAAALLATAAFAQDEDSTRLAAATATFSKLDADADGRVSAIEAANDSKVAQGFTTADVDRDGYLSKAEFAQLGKAMDRNAPSDSAQPRSQTRPESDSSVPKPQD